MELKPGYKDTEAGIIPDGWASYHLENLCVAGGLVRGPFGGNLKKDFFVKEGFKVYEQRNAIYRSVDIGSYFIDQTKYLELKRFEVAAGDFIVSCSGTIGRIFQMPENTKPGVINQALLKITLNNGVVYSDYFYQTFVWDRFQQKIIDSTQGGAMQNLVGMDVFKKTSIALPPLPEQRAIAAALSDTDALLSSLDRLLAKKRDIKQSVMQRLLTGKQRLPGFSGEWERKDFGNLSSPRRERIDPKRSKVLDFCVEMEHIEPETGHLLGHTSTGEQSSLKTVFRSGDVLFGKLRAYLRKYWLADRQGVCSTEIWSLVPNLDLVTPAFLFQIVKTEPFVDAASTAYGTHMPRSDWNTVNKLEINLPSRPEQTAIAEVLSDMDAEIDALTQRREKTRLLKQGMMQELLTGRTRLV